MDLNRRNNIARTTDALCDSLDVAWHYVLLLRGFRDAYRMHQGMNEMYGRVVNKYWQALWDALFARMGTYFDRAPGTHSIPSLQTQLRRTKEPQLIALATGLQRSLDASAELIDRFMRWRNEVVGHSSTTLVHDEFNRESMVHLADAEALLEQVEEMANKVSTQVSNRVVDVQYWHPQFAAEAAAFLAAAERGLSGTQAPAK